MRSLGRSDCPDLEKKGFRGSSSGSLLNVQPCTSHSSVGYRFNKCFDTTLVEERLISISISMPVTITIHVEVGERKESGQERRIGDFHSFFRRGFRTYHNQALGSRGSFRRYVVSHKKNRILPTRYDISMQLFEIFDTMSIAITTTMSTVDCVVYDQSPPPSSGGSNLKCCAICVQSSCQTPGFQQPERASCSSSPRRLRGWAFVAGGRHTSIMSNCTQTQ